MTAPGAGLPSKAPTTGQPSGPRPAGPPEWLSSSHVRALHSCIVYDARDRNHPAISSGVTSCKAEANAAQTAYRRRRPSLRPPAIPSSRAAIASQAVSGATSSPSLCQTQVNSALTAFRGTLVSKPAWQARWVVRRAEGDGDDAARTAGSSGALEAGPARA